MGQIALQIPIAGSPNSSEDPKVASNFSTLQTWANGHVDTTNLSATAGITHAQLAATAISNVRVFNGSGGTLNEGDLALCVNGPFTITLPAVSASARVSIVAQQNVSATSAITVSAGAALIYGLGLSGVSSFSLGALGANATLISDGTSWNVVAGQQDTGWTALTLSTNIGAASGLYAPTARLTGDRVFLRGAVQNNTGSPQGNAYVFATIPAGLRPSQTVRVSLPLPVASPVMTEIATSGTMALGNAGGALWISGASFALDGLSYSTS